MRNWSEFVEILLFCLGILFVIFSLWAAYHNNAFGQSQTWSLVALNLFIASYLLPRR